MQTVVFESGDNSEVLVEQSGGTWLLNGKPASIEIHKINEHYYNLLVDGQSFNIQIENGSQQGEIVKVNQKIISGEVRTALDSLLEKMGMSKSAVHHVTEIKAPMPGLIIKIMVKNGIQIKKGDPILILEAMKMENIIKSPIDGIIKYVKVKEQESVAKNQILIEF